MKNSKITTTDPFTDKKFKAECGRISRILREWQFHMGLGNWRIDIDYHRSAIKPQGEDGYDVIGLCHVKWQYLDATIQFDCSQTVDKDFDELNYIIAHELTHIFVNEMRNFEHDDGVHHEERVVTQIAKGFIFVRQLGYAEGLKAAKKKKK